MGREYPPGTLARVQQIELDMLREFDRICRANGLTYFADGGTCLGAVRHGGFIPWDDDIDIGMPIDDFLKFEEIAKNGLPFDMEFHTPHNDSNLLVLWGKLCKKNTLFVEQDAWETGSRTGIFLDIIPYINLNMSSSRGVRQLNRTEMLAKMNYIYRIAHPSVLEGKMSAGLLKKAWSIVRFLLHHTTTPEYILTKYEMACKCYDPSEWWANPAASKPWPYHHDALFDPVEMEFCDLVIFVPRDANTYLTTLYGDDYMVLPVPEKRHTHTPYILDLGDGLVFDLEAKEDDIS